MKIMYSNIVFSIGAILNVLVLCYCCKKWKIIGNIKLLVAMQAVLSFLTISANLGLVTENVHWFPEGKFLCYQLPNLVIFLLCLAIFNFTCLVCVKYAQISDNWYLRRSTVMLIFLTVFGFSTSLSSPVFYSIYKGGSILRFDDCMENTSNISDAEVKKEDHINVVRYLFWFLILQFIVPAFIIASRVVLILIHLWQEESTTDTTPKPNNQVAIRFTVNTTFTILFAVVTVFLLLRKSLDDMDSDEALDFLNVLFHKCFLISVAVLCCPWHILTVYTHSVPTMKKTLA